MLSRLRVHTHLVPVRVICLSSVHRAEYEELKAAKEKAEEDTIFSFKRKKGCQAERKQARG